jgi:hypothetical protein
MHIKSCNLGQLLRPCLSNETGCSEQRVQGQVEGRASRSVSREVSSAGTKRSRFRTHPRESSECTASLAPGVGKGRPTDRTHGSRCSCNDRAFRRHAQVVESPLHHWPLKEAERTSYLKPDCKAYASVLRPFTRRPNDRSASCRATRSPASAHLVERFSTERGHVRVCQASRWACTRNVPQVASEQGGGGLRWRARRGAGASGSSRRTYAAADVKALAPL